MSNADLNHHQVVRRWRSVLDQACRSQDYTEIQNALDEGKKDSRIDAVTFNEVLRTALHRAVDSGEARLVHSLLVQEDAAQFLLEKNFSSILHRSIGRHDLLGDLLDHGANVHLEIKDKFGRTPLCSAVRKGDLQSAEILLKAGADIDAKGSRGQSLLVAIAAEGDSASIFQDRLFLVEWLVGRKADVHSADSEGRTALHWASSTGPVALVSVLLRAGAHLEARTVRGLTPLHVACTVNPGSLTAAENHAHIAGVKQLLEEGADPTKRTIEGRTALHIAAQEGNAKIVDLLLKTNIDVNALTQKGDSALHWAAQQGHVDVVKSLLHKDGIKPELKDPHGLTALWRASRKANLDVMVKLSPIRYARHLSSDEEASCKSHAFDATVVEFTAKGDDGRCNRKHWQESIYDLFYTRKSLFRNPRKESSKRFRWIHIPANNLAWIETLFAKLLVEDEARNFEAFDVLLRSLRDRQDGPKVHSKYMVPKCTHIQGPMQKPNKKMTSDVSETSSHATEDSLLGGGSVVALYMPFLHYESHERRVHMSSLIKHCTEGSALLKIDPAMDSNDYITLMRAYLNKTSNLHPRRTLDQFFYQGLDTGDRDSDQVLSKYCLEANLPREVVMIDQLWMWIFSDNVVVTSFSYRGRRHQSQWDRLKLQDPLDVLSRTIDECNMAVTSVDDLAAHLIARCTQAFDQHRFGPFGLSCMDIFQSMIGDMSFREPSLLREFASASSAAEVFIETQAGEIQKIMKAVDKLSQMREETRLLREIKDIQEELSIIRMVVQQQSFVINDFATCLEERAKQSSTSGAVWRRWLAESNAAARTRMETLRRLDEQAHSLTQALTQLLEFKRMHATAFEGCFARRQALETASQGKTIMVFTIVTIIFLPISFLATLFSINNLSLGEGATGGLSLSYVSKYVFGIGLSISAVLVLIAFQAIKVQNFLSTSFANLGSRSTYSGAPRDFKMTPRPAIRSKNASHDVSEKNFTHSSFKSDFMGSEVQISPRASTVFSNLTLRTRTTGKRSKTSGSQGEDTIV